MYYKVTDKNKNVFIFAILKDKEIHYEQKKNNFWRIANITSRTILVPKFNSSQNAIEFLKTRGNWEVEEIDMEFTFE